MIRRAAPAVLLSITLAVPLATPLSAQLHWLNQCMPGAMHACMSFAMELEYDPTPWIGPFTPVVTEGQTRVSLTVENMQPEGVPTMFRRAIIWGLESDWTTGVEHPFWDGGADFTTTGPIYAINKSGLGSYGESSNDPYLLYWESWAVTERHDPAYDNQIQFYGTDRTGIYGCSTPDVIHTHYSMCGGSITFSASIPGRWSFTDLTRIEWEGYTVTPGEFSNNFDRMTCTTGVTCVSVPEPGSLLLLVTGILGIAYQRRRLA